jgi:membrane associated rhomboid family serine protease
VSEARTGAAPDLDAGRLSNPWTTCLVAALLSMVFAAQWWVGAVDPESGGYVVYLVGGLHAPSVREGELFRIVTAPLLHMHVHHFLANAAALLGLGATLEAQIGHSRLFLVVAVSMLAGSVANVVLPTSGGVSVGASAALFGMLGAWGALALRQRPAPSPLLRRVPWVIPFVFVAEAAVALLLPARIGWVAHLGGFVGGMAAMAVLARGAGPIPLAKAKRRMRVAVALLCALFLLGGAVSLARVASGRICQVLERGDLSVAVRAGLGEALRQLPVTCADPVRDAN